jgi:NitT/TauT family transport system substrate-binding protein
MMRLSIRFAFLLGLGLLIAGCAQPQTPIRLGTNVWPGYEPLYLAQEIGQLDSRKVRLIGYPSASEVIRAFRNRSLEAASLTLDEALLLLDKGLPIKIILVHDISHGADVILARPHIEEVSGLRGRDIAVESSALGAYVISRALEKNNLSVDAVRIRHLDVNQHEAAYHSGEVDAVVTFEPFNTRLKELGAQEIFTSREIPGEIIDVLVVHEDIHETRLDDLKHLTRSWFSALEYIDAEPQKAATIMSKRLKISNEDVLASYQGMKLPTYDQNIAMLNDGLSALHRLAAIMSEHELVTNDLELEELLSSDALYQK